MKEIYRVCSLLLFTILSLMSCNRTIKSSAYMLEKDTVSIHVGYAYLADYFQYTIEKIDGETILSGYNYLTNSVDLFNLDKAEVIKSVVLQNEGPNEIVAPMSAHLFGVDSILIHGTYSIYLIDWNGRVIWEKEINTNGRTYSKSVFHYSKIIWEGEWIFFWKYPWSNLAELTQDNFVVKYNLVTEELVDVPIYFNDEIKADPNSYPEMWYPFIAKNSNGFVYGFPMTSNLYYYSESENRSFTYNIESTVNNQFASSKKNYPHITSYDYCQVAENYFPALPIQGNDYLFRLHRLDRYDKNQKPSYYAMIVNKEFKIIQEFEIENGEIYFPYQSFSDGEGVYIPVKAEYTGESNLVFHYFALCTK